MTARGQSSVVGVAVLLGVTVVSLGLLTAGIGGIVDGAVTATNADHVATDLEDALSPTPVGISRSRIEFTDGTLRTAERTVRVVNDTETVVAYPADALVFTAGGERVGYLAGALVRGDGPGARMRVTPSVTARDDSVVVGLPLLNVSTPRAVAGGDADVVLRTNATHSRRHLDPAEHGLAVETAVPGPWEKRFREQGANTSRRDFDGDGVDSVVARYPDERSVDLVVSDLRLEVVT